jgi:hypothetical protein
MVLFARQLSISRKRLISNDKGSCTAQSYLVWRVDLWSMAQGPCLKSQERIRMKMAGRCLVDHPLISMVGGVDRSHEVPGSVAKHPVGASKNCSVCSG